MVSIFTSAGAGMAAGGVCGAAGCLRARACHMTTDDQPNRNVPLSSSLCSFLNGLCSLAHESPEIGHVLMRGGRRANRDAHGPPVSQ